MNTDLFDKPNSAVNYLYMIGYQSITEFVEFVQSMDIRGKTLSDKDLLVNWRAAKLHLRSLAKTECELANFHSLDDLPSGWTDVSKYLAAEEDGASAFSRRWAVVELDRLTVFQKYVDLETVAAVESYLPTELLPEDIASIALGESLPSPSVTVSRPGGTTFQFNSPSRDVRCLELRELDPATVLPRAYHRGRPISVIGIVIGAGAPVLSAVYCRRRIALLNGTHRGIALRKRGVTHVPCLIYLLNDEDELGMLGRPELSRDAGLYFSSRRPPLFKDYFASDLCQPMLVGKANRSFSVNISFERHKIPLSVNK